MTYGQIRLRLSKLLPGIDVELIDGWVQDRYAMILDLLAWKRLEGEAVFQVPLSYAIGTVSAQQGSNAITGSGTTWTSDMTGLMIRINNGTEYYTFTYVSATSATLDREYEGSTASIITGGFAVATAGAGYNAGDIIYPAGGNGLAQLQVLTVGPGGSVATLGVVAGGNNYTVQNGVVTTTTGRGTGLTINITQVGLSAGLPYRIDQNIFQLPAECRILRGVRPLHDRDHPLEIISPAEMSRRTNFRNLYGTPRWACQTWDTATDPPIMQVELGPVPNSPDSLGNALSFVVDYVYDPPALFDGSSAPSTGQTVLPWVRPYALIEGVQASALTWKADQNPQAASAFLGAAGRHEQAFTAAMQNLAFTNAQQRGAQPMRLAHELRRQPPHAYHRGPHHRGFNG